MKKIIIVVVILLVALLFGAKLLIRPESKTFTSRDEENIRSLFNVLSDVKLESFSNSLQTDGTFGREGLNITAIFQFNDAQFADYLKKTEDKRAWEPVSFKFRSPEIDKKFTEKSLEWNKAPLTSNALKSKKELILKNQMGSVTNGIYRCHFSRYRYDELPHYFKRYSCDEPIEKMSESIESPQDYAWTIGVLDINNKKLYIEYQM